MPNRRVAVIAVHGVADQQPGETVRNIADLLSNIDAADGPVYAPFVPADVSMPVRRVDVPAVDQADAGKTFAQRADALRARRSSLAAPHGDANIEFMATLLAGYRGGDPDDTFKTTVFRGQRHALGESAPVDVDVYEMYWADLSRLAANAFRIFGEIYQLLFHVGSLGVNVVRSAQVAETSVGGPWSAWAAAQTLAAECLAVHLLIVNLLFIGLAIVVLSFVIPQAYAAVVALVVAGAIAAFVIGFALFRRAPRSSLAWIAPLLALGGCAAAGAGWYVLRLMARGWFGAAWIERASDWLAWGSALPIHARMLIEIEAVLVAAVALGVVVRFYGAARPVVTRWAFAYGAIFSGWLLYGIVAWEPAPAQAGQAALFLAEALYCVLGAIWAAFLTASWVAFLFGARVKAAANAACRAAAPGARSAATDACDRIDRARWTARLTLALPAAGFLVMTTLLWAGFRAAASPLKSIRYQPHFFIWLMPVDPHATAHDWSASDFVGGLVLNGGALNFAVVLALAAVAAILAIYAMAPIAFAEVSPFSPSMPGASTGRWLDHGLNLLRVAGRLLVLAVLVVLPITMLGSFLPQHRMLDWAEPARKILAWSAGFLVPAAAGLFAFGGRLKSLALGFRSVVDVLLDVDNYLREHPIDATPRARICARYASMLRYVYAQSYDAVVIIAHSQGTVISADLLRFIKATGLENRDVRLALRPARLCLFTMGSPLRQLYGLRFPHLYRWARHEEIPDVPVIDASTPPVPADLNVAEWVNAYRSGDYVGRWLWRSDDCGEIYNVPASLGAPPWHAGTLNVMASESAPPPDRREFCIGAGAHTHYWDYTAPEIALQLDELIVAR